MATSVDPATIGQYGTVRLLSNKTNHPIASYPIDQPTTTFGRDEACDIRMYFLWVSSLHCKLIFEDYKAFLTVSSPNGVIVDGCGVFPSEATGEATTVPLTNRSVLAIHNKRFIFEYPPKELRVKAFMTPRPKSRKSLRLSMINAAHILTPARGTPRHLSAALDLDVLRSPVKPYAQSPLKEMREEEVRVVDGENVVVVEQEQDLVLLEELDEDTSKSYPEPQTPTPSTPIRPRSNSKARMSLHKAVLVRNSRRALQRQEQDPGAPSNRPQQAGEPPATSYDQHEQHEQNASGHQDAGQQDYAVYSDEEEEEEQEEPQPKSPAPARGLSFRKSLEALASVFGSVKRSLESASPQPPDDDSSEDEEEGSNEDRPGEHDQEYDDEQDAEYEEDEGDENLPIITDLATSADEDNLVEEDAVDEYDAPEAQESDTDINDQSEEMEQGYDKEIQLDDEEAFEIEEEVPNGEGGQEDEESVKEEEDEATLANSGVSAPPETQGTPRRSSIAPRHVGGFFTPQQPPSRLNDRRADLLQTAGPAARGVRFESQPRKRLSVLPGLPQRLLVTKSEVEEDEELELEENEEEHATSEEEDEAEPEDEKEEYVDEEVFAEVTALREQRRQSVLAVITAAPRTLSAPPPRASLSPMKRPVKVESDEDDDDDKRVASIQGLKDQMMELRRQSVRRAQRMSLGVATPAKPLVIQGTTAELEVKEEEDDVDEEPSMQSSESESLAEDDGQNEGAVTDIPSTPGARLYPTLPLDNIGSQDSPASSSTGRLYPELPQTPRFDGLKHVFAPPPPKTPHMNGLRNMFAEPAPQVTPNFAGVRQMLQPPVEQATPSFAGIKNLLREPPQEPKTPMFSGVRDLFKDAVVPQTPDMEGLDQIFSGDEEEEQMVLDGVLPEEEGHEEESAEASAVVKPVADKAASRIPTSRVPAPRATAKAKIPAKAEAAAATTAIRTARITKAANAALAAKAQPAAAVVVSRRNRTASRQESEINEVAVTKSSTAPARIRSTRAKAAEEGAVEPAPKTRAAGKATAVKKEGDVVASRIPTTSGTRSLPKMTAKSKPDEAPPAPKAPVRRGRSKTSDEPPAEEQEATAPSSSKTTRASSRAKTPQEEVVQKDQPAAPVRRTRTKPTEEIPSAIPARRPRTRTASADHAAAAPTAMEDDTDDALSAGTAEGRASPIEPSTGARVRRSPRVKDEPVESTAQLPGPATKTGRRTPVPRGAAAAATKKAGSGGNAGKRIKTEPDDKENSPGGDPTPSSRTRSAAAASKSEKPVKAGSAVQAEATGPARVLRTTRARK